MTTTSIPDHAFTTILNIADEAERADAQIKRHMRHIVNTRQFDLLGEAINKWLDDPPVEVVKWLHEKAPLPPGTTPLD